jgi:hypothetical protein
MNSSKHLAVLERLEQARNIPPEGRVMKRKDQADLRLVSDIEKYLDMLDKGAFEDDTCILVQPYTIAEEDYYIDTAGWVYDQMTLQTIGKWDEDEMMWEIEVAELWDGFEEENSFS